MISKSRRVRAHSRRSRIAAALAAAGALVLSSGLVLLNAPAATAAPGNNGTVKVGDTGDLDEGRPENDPHLPCTFNIQWFNYDADQGDITSTVTVELQSPTATGRTMSVSGDTTPVIVSNGGKPGAGDGFDRLEWYTLAFTGDPHPEQGYHVKITVNTPHSKGNDVKHKVFWVGPCESEQEPTVIEAGVTPVQPVCDNEGVAGATFADEDRISYALKEGSPEPAAGVTSTWVATIKDTALYSFAGGATSTEVSATYDAFDPMSCGGGGGEEQIVTPGVTFDDVACFDESFGWAATVDGTPDGPGDGVTFAVTDGEVAPGRSVTITATAGEGYAFDSEGLRTMTFSHDFAATPDEDECIQGEQEIVPQVTFVDPTCAKPNRAGWTGTFGDLVDYTVAGSPGRGRSIVVTATIKKSVAGDYAFPEGFDNTFEHRYPTLADLQCVKGTETVRPKPQGDPTVLGTQAALPTAVDAGLVGAAPARSASRLPAQLMVGGGLVLLLAGGWVGLGRRGRGLHQA